MNLTNRTRAALRARQRKIEDHLCALEAHAESSAGDPALHDWSTRHARLMEEWDEIEVEWERRAALTGDEAMRDLLSGTPQTHDFGEETSA